MPNTTPPHVPAVYAAIAAVMADVGKEGIAKSRRNEQQNYKFRGIDDVYNALSASLSKHRLLMLPRVISRELVERQTAANKPLFYVTVAVEFDFVSAVDGSRHVVLTYGEAMDTADKATNKAMSAAYKYAAMQAFCIPTEGDNDADAVTHEVAPKQVPTSVAATAKAPPASLSQRADTFLAAVQAAPDTTALGDLHRRGESLLKELEQKLPERLVEVNAGVEARLLDLEEEAAMEGQP